MDFERVEYMLEVISGNDFMRQLAIEQLLYNVMVGKGDGRYHLVMGEDTTTYALEFSRLLAKLGGQETVSFIDYDEMLFGCRLIRDTDKLVLGTGTKWSDITDKDESILKYLVDNEPMYIEPVFAREGGRTLRFGGIVVQKCCGSFIDNLSKGLQRRVDVIQFGYVAAKEDFDMDADLVEELKMYLRARYEE